MRSTNSVQLQFPKLNRRNFNNQTVQLKVLFKLQDFWNLVKSGYTKVADMEAFDALRKKEKDLLTES